MSTRTPRDSSYNIGKSAPKRMFRCSLLSSCVVFVGASLIICACAAAGYDCLDFNALSAVSFDNGFTQSRRRTPNGPRLNCVGNCPPDAYLDSAQCTRTGMSDDGLPSWKCIGNFPRGGPSSGGTFRLGNIKVRCEGCDFKGDTNVRKGSCSLDYSVIVDDVPSSSTRPRSSSQVPYYEYPEPSLSDGSVFESFLGSVLFIAFMVGVFFCICPLQQGIPQPLPNVPRYNFTGFPAPGFGTGILAGLGLNWFFNRPRNPFFGNNFNYGWGGGGYWNAPNIYRRPPSYAQYGSSSTFSSPRTPQQPRSSRNEGSGLGGSVSM